MSAGTRRSSSRNNEESEEVNDDTAVADGGPGLVYMPFVVMEDLLDKLKLLNYEEVCSLCDRNCSAHLVECALFSKSEKF